MNFFEFFCCLVIFGVFGLLEDLLFIRFRRKEAKKHNYNCKECGIWDCPNKECLKFRNTEGS